MIKLIKTRPFDNIVAGQNPVINLLYMSMKAESIYGNGLLNFVYLPIYGKFGLVVGTTKQMSDSIEVDILKCKSLENNVNLSSLG